MSAKQITADWPIAERNGATLKAMNCEDLTRTPIVVGYSLDSAKY